MGFLRSAARASVGAPSTLATPEKWVVDWFSGGAKSLAGVTVTPENALTWAPFFAGVRNLSDDIGSLPLPVYERLDRGKRRATNHPVYELLHDAPNEIMGAMQLRSTIQGHALTWGGGAAYVESNNRGIITSLWPLRPDRLHPEVVRTRVGRVEVRYRYVDHVNRIYAALLPEEVLYVPGFGFDGIRGYSAIELGRNSIGLGLATEMHGAAFFGNGAKPGALLKHPKAVTDDARRRIKSDWESLHRGLDKSQRIAILEEGVEYEAIGIPNDDAQFLETRKFQVDDAVRWLRIPAHKLGNLEHATYSNIEQQSLDYVIDSLRPWLVRWEQAILRTLFTGPERSRFFAEHMIEGLLRGDIKTRYEAYAIGRQWGWESSNSILEKENRNPIPNGDLHLVPLNMVPLDQLAESGSEGPRTARLALRGSEGRRRIGEAFAPLVEDMDRRMAKLEQAEVGQLVRKHLEPRSRSTSAFLAAVEALYDGLIRDRALERWLPLFTTYAAEVATSAASDVGHDGDVDLSRWVEAYVQSHVGYHLASSVGQIATVLDGADDPAAAVEARTAKWVEHRPGRTAKWESVQMPSAAARETWKVAGVRKMQWVTTGDDCPFCQDLDGRIVGIDEPFLPAGATASPTGLEEKLEIKRNTFHPPLHPGCDCRIVSA